MQRRDLDRPETEETSGHASGSRGSMDTADFRDEPPTPSMVVQDPLLGQVLDGRYRLNRLIARGSMGKVYLAEQMPLGRQVAVKVLDLREAYVSGTSTGSERFLREASTLARLTHPNTVRVFDFGVWEGRDCLVMEFVPGRSLHAILKAQGPLHPLRALRITRQVASSLREAHSLGIVHRDLKPGNLLIAPDGDQDVVKVVDFGLVKDLEDAAEMTGDGHILGSPLYMAPEQIRSDAVDGRADLYSLGVVLYRMLTGTTPFPNSGTASVLMSHLTKPPAGFDVNAPPEPLPERVERLVFRLLAKDPGQRFPDAAHLIGELDLCLAELGPEESQGSLVVAPDTVPLPVEKNRTGLFIGGVALLLVLTALVTWTLVRVFQGEVQEGTPLPVAAEPAPSVAPVGVPPVEEAPEPLEPIEPAAVDPEPVAPSSRPPATRPSKPTPQPDPPASASKPEPPEPEPVAVDPDPLEPDPVEPEPVEPEPAEPDPLEPEPDPEPLGDPDPFQTTGSDLINPFGDRP